MSQEKLSEWQRQEEARVCRLQDAQCRSRAAYLRLDGCTAMRRNIDARSLVRREGYGRSEGAKQSATKATA